MMMRLPLTRKMMMMMVAMMAMVTTLKVITQIDTT